MEKYGFVYIWRDRKHNRYYIGCHWGTETDRYICSSTWMRKAKNRRPEDFKRRILKSNIQTRHETYIAEQYYLNMIKPEEIKVRYYNFKLKNFWVNKTKEDLNIFIEQNINKKLSDETKQKIREARKTQKCKPRSEETKEKIRQSLLGTKHPEERKAKLRGQKRTDGSKDKMRKAQLGKKQSEEQINKKVEKAKLYWQSEKGLIRKEQLRQHWIDNNPKTINY